MSDSEFFQLFQTAL